MKCDCCGRVGIGEEMPRGWKVFGRAVLCRECRRARFALRSVTMPVVEPIGDSWQEFLSALEEAWRQASPLPIHPHASDLMVAQGQPVVRVPIGGRWWALRLNGGDWSGGRRAAYEKIASGDACGELLLYRQAASGIVCKAVAWLPRTQLDNSLPADANGMEIEACDIHSLRRAVRGNWVSFPSQVPVFGSAGAADMERRAVQLYFVMGWCCREIAVRYALTEQQVRTMLKAWKQRAIKAGYIQRIPPAVVPSEFQTLDYHAHWKTVAEAPAKLRGRTGD